MFGYITVNRAELKVKESAAYDAVYVMHFTAFTDVPVS